MAIYTTSKTPQGGLIYPESAKDPGTWDRLEPLISPEQVREDQLFGVPMVSALPDPITGQLSRYTDSLIKRRIEASVSEIEEELHMRIFPMQISERAAYIYADFANSFGFFRLRQRPISSIEKLAIVSSDGTLFYSVDLAWIDTGYLSTGQIHILPLSPVAGSADVSSGSAIIGGQAAAIFMNFLAQARNIPAYWTIEYTIGFPDGKIPRIVNELIGIQTALNILSVLAPTYQKTSSSLGIDGMSQSNSTPGPNLFVQRIKELEEKKAKIVKQLKTKLGSGGITVGAI